MTDKYTKYLVDAVSGAREMSAYAEKQLVFLENKIFTDAKKLRSRWEQHKAYYLGKGDAYNDALSTRCNQEENMTPEDWWNEYARIVSHTTGKEIDAKIIGDK